MENDCCLLPDSGKVLDLLSPRSNFINSKYTFTCFDVRFQPCVSPVCLKARAEAELGAALAGERMQRDGELTEIKCVVDEMMTLDASASGGGIAGRGRDLFSPPRRGAGGSRRSQAISHQPRSSSEAQHDTTLNFMDVGAAAR